MQQANTATVEDVDDVDDVGAKPAPTTPAPAPTTEPGVDSENLPDPQTAASPGAGRDNQPDPQTAPETDEVTDENGVHFLDAVGRKYLFPYEGVRTWEQFSGLIRETFNHIGRIRAPVLQGQYDIYDAQERIVLPAFWERTVRPGGRFVMRMWPETNPRRFQPGMPPPPPPSAFQPGAKPPPPSGTLYDIASGKVQSEDAKDEPVVVEETVAPLPKPSSKKQNDSFLAWITGKAPKKSSKKKVKQQPIDIPQDDSGSLVQVVARPRAVQPAKLRSSWPLQPLAKRSLPRRPPPSDDSGSSSSSIGSSGLRDRRPGSSNSSSSSSSSSDENGPSNLREFVLDEGAVFSLIMSRDDLDEMESKVLRRPTFLGSERVLEPSDCLRFSSARIMGSDGSEPLELVKAAPLKAGDQQNTSSAMVWIHVQRTHLNFNEFENIACFELTQDVALRNTIARLFQKIRDKKRDKEWYIKPGTVLRCDIHLKDENRDLTDLSPIFASIPNLHVAKFNRKLAPEPNQAYCPPRRLHEAFGQLDQTAAHDKTQQFRKQEGAKTDEILWEGQTWILVTKSGLITYGDVSRSQLESDNITVSDPIASKDAANQIVQLIDNQNRLSFAPLDQCRSFFELQGVVRHHAEKMDHDVYDASIVRLQTASGEELTAGKWSALLKSNEIPMIRWELEYEYLSDSEPSEHGSSFISYDDIGLGTPKTTRSVASSLRSRSGTHLPSSKASSHVTLDHDEDDLNFLSQDRAKAEGMYPATITEEEEKSGILEIPESDPRVPPFLSWLPADAELSESGDTLMKRLALVESGIMRIPEKPHLDSLIEDSYKAFQETDVFYESQPKSFKDFEFRRKSLKERQNITQQASSNHGSRFSQNEGSRISSLADNLLDLCTRVFESFAPKDLPAPSISRCFGALSRVLEDPVTTAILDYADDADIPDPDPDESPPEAKTNRWVIALRAQTELHRPGNTSCEDCEKGRVYDKTSAAIAHLRRSHAVGLGGDAGLGEYVLTLKEASEERLRESYLEILRRCCKTMAGVARKAASIQAGVLYQDGFRRPIAGLPPPLFKAFKLLVVFLCALPRLLDTVSWRFKDDVVQSKVRYLSSSRLEIQRRAVYRLGVAVEEQVYIAERVLASPELSSGRADGLIKGRLMEVVQPSYVAAQVIWNLTRIHVYEDKHLADLYDGYLKIQRSHVLRRPEKRLVLSIGALKDEMTLVSEFISTQFKAIEVFAAVLSPDSRITPVVEEVDAFEQLEMSVIERIGSRLLQQSKHFQRMDKACDHLADEVRGLAEIMADQTSRAMMIFTIVTVFFSPPGFVAAYLSMGDGPDGLDFAGLQRRFWTIAGPLTVTVWAICLFLAFGGAMNSPLDKARATVDEWRVRRQAAKDQGVDEEESPYVVEYGV